MCSPQPMHRVAEASLPASEHDAGAEGLQRRLQPIAVGATHFLMYGGYAGGTPMQMSGGAQSLSSAHGGALEAGVSDSPFQIIRSSARGGAASLAGVDKREASEGTGSTGAERQARHDESASNRALTLLRVVLGRVSTSIRSSPRIPRRARARVLGAKTPIETAHVSGWRVGLPLACRRPIRFRTAARAGLEQVAPGPRRRRGTLLGLLDPRRCVRWRRSPHTPPRDAGDGGGVPMDHRTSTRPRRTLTDRATTAVRRSTRSRTERRFLAATVRRATFPRHCCLTSLTVGDCGRRQQGCGAKSDLPCEAGLLCHDPE